MLPAATLRVTLWQAPLLPTPFARFGSPQAPRSLWQPADADEAGALLPN